VVTLPAARRSAAPTPSPQLASQVLETTDVHPLLHLTEQHPGVRQHDDLPTREGLRRKLVGKGLIGRQRRGSQRPSGSG
jgi:hypothetical protein